MDITNDNPPGAEAGGSDGERAQSGQAAQCLHTATSAELEARLRDLQAESDAGAARFAARLAAADQDSDATALLPDWAAEIVTAARADPAVAFEAENLELLAGLRAHMPADFERARGALKAAGVRVSSLDRALDQAAASASDTGGADGLPGRAIVFAPEKPWPAPVALADALDEAADFLRRHVILPDGAAEAGALWCAHTFAFENFSVTPRAMITSAEKRCGKTRLLDALGHICARRLDTANVSAAAIFRVIEKARPSLFIDEADTFLAEREELRGVLNAGWTRAGQVLRCVGDEAEPRAFSVFAPVAVAAIGKLPDTLADRSIRFAMRRKLSGEKVQRLRAGADPGEPIRRKFARLADERGEAWGDAEPVCPDHLDDRATDNWGVLLAIADDAGRDWPDRARAACEAMSAAGADEPDSIRTRLLADIQKAIASEGNKKPIASARLCEILADDEGAPWAAFGRAEKPITPTALARLLRPFGIRPATRRDGEATHKGYDVADFRDAFARYVPTCAPEPPSATVTPSQAKAPLDNCGQPNRNADRPVTPAKSPQAQGPLDLLPCDGSNPPSGWADEL